MSCQPSTSTATPTWIRCPQKEAIVLRRRSEGQSTPRAPARSANESQLSKKRERVTPKVATAPKVVKTSTRRSLFNKKRSTDGFITLGGQKPLSSSPLYDPSKGISFFEQLFGVEGVLGRGSFGEVVAARCRLDGHVYAVKRTAQKSSTALKHQEALSLLRIPSHQNVLEFYQAWEEEEHVYIQTEVCHQTLLNWSTCVGGLTERDTWNVLVDLMQAVDHLHRINMIHNDIKPENVLLTRAGVCKLGDFGLAMEVKPNENHLEEGDNRYMAPEILTMGASKATDIFSLGATILETLTDLEMPTGGEAWHDVRDGLIPERMFKGATKDLRELMDAMMAKDPEERATIEMLLEHPGIQKRLEERNRYVKEMELNPQLAEPIYLTLPLFAESPENQKATDAQEDDVTPPLNFNRRLTLSTSPRRSPTGIPKKLDFEILNDDDSPKENIPSRLNFDDEDSDSDEEEIQPTRRPCKRRCESVEGTPNKRPPPRRRPNTFSTPLRQPCFDD
ncbi:hypothetical protein GCK72_004746 [Caenorhabditis remanei]|uniref:non-specific serine/threonine protein kinase n=1 Tax=Caenorhabditis remanei TaxID=31234 RepID=A0A6A5HD86_CAERE|nr:hypothetical protein GCK72_004746 [Caenorhabditis remanei]KAF1764796.1 hypothetical protein GCK72_004746 [Caenorhabditis remanei]